MTKEEAPPATRARQITNGQRPRDDTEAEAAEAAAGDDFLDVAHRAPKDREKLPHSPLGRFGRYSSISEEQLPVASSDAVQMELEKTFLAVLMLCAKFATEKTYYSTVRSEVAKRKFQGLKLLGFAIECGVHFFHSKPGYGLSVRRFVVPAIISCLDTEIPTLFRPTLRLFMTLWQHYKDLVFMELGVAMDSVFLEMLAHPLCNAKQKKDIIDCLQAIFRSPQELVDLFYNYDTQFRSWRIFERLVKALGSLITSGIPKASAIDYDKEQEEKGTKEEMKQAVSVTGPTLHALKFLVNILRSQAEWLGVPGLRSQFKAHWQTTLQQRQPAPDKDTESIGRSRATTLQQRVSQQDTMKIRYEHLRATAAEKGLRKAFLKLRASNPECTTPHEVAKFLHAQEYNVDMKEIGDFLGSEFDNLFSEKEYVALRREFCLLIDFTAITLDEGLRMFLCESGFRLPGEGQKIDRLVEAFCKGYCRDNPGTFKHVDNAHVVSFGLIMLHTDAHNKSIDKKKKMTLKQFLVLLRGTNNGADFPKAYLEQMYFNIVMNEWEMTEEKPYEDKGIEEENREEFRRQRGIMLRKAQAKQRTLSVFRKSPQRCRDPTIVRPMFDRLWHENTYQMAFQSCRNLPDTDTLQEVVDGLALASTISVAIGNLMEMKVFSIPLAEIGFLEAAKAEKLPVKGAQSTKIQILKGKHINQEWYTPIRIGASNKPVKACKALIQASMKIKSQIVDHKRAAVLRRLQMDFGSEYILEYPNRVLVKKDKLTKVDGHGGRKHEYYFFLFNDLFVYASEGMKERYKVHRVMHLSLCNIVDIRSEQFEHAFLVKSAQKSVFVCAPTAAKKKEWVRDLTLQLKEIIRQRTEYIKDNQAGSTTTETASPLKKLDTESELLRRYSTFIGEAYASKSNEGRAVQGCSMCIRSFSIMRRRMKCKNCGNVVCTECCNQKSRKIPNCKTRQKVCDACYGFLESGLAESQTENSVLTVQNMDQQTTTSSLTSKSPVKA